MSTNHPSLTNKICPMPFEYFDIHDQKDGAVKCYTCCPTIVPRPVGDLSKNTIEEIWNGDIYQEIRESILDGSYKYCNKDLCPEIQTGNLIDIKDFKVHHIAKAKRKGLSTFKGKPKTINLSYDRTCNLACPSCRTDYITQNSEEDDRLIAKITDDLLSRDLSHTTIIACSSGDPFVGTHFRRLLFALNGKDHPGLKIQIMSNGILFNRQAWESMHKIHRNINRVCISLDAATASTYSITRRGGNWNILMKNLEFLSLLRSRNEIEFLRLDFVVQDHNYKEMREFIALGEKLKIDEVFFQKVANWGYFTEEEFTQRAIYKNNHPLYEDFLRTIARSDFNKKIVNHGNLGHFFSIQKMNSFNIRNAIKHSLQNIYKRYL